MKKVGEVLDGSSDVVKNLETKFIGEIPIQIYDRIPKETNGRNS